jgi:uncharacterized membrane protein YtjA (UPF0391 family)
MVSGGAAVTATADFVPPIHAFHRRFEVFRGRNQAAASCLFQQADRPHMSKRIEAMLGWVLTFLVVALIAGVLGFGGIAGASIEIAKVIFFIAVVLFLVSVIFGAFRGRSPS